MVEIPLTRGCTAKIDDQDAIKTNKYKWRLHVSGGGRKYASTGQGRNLILLHRLLMNPSFGMCVDHADGDGLNCQRDNLRICTYHQNMGNINSIPHSSRFKGVSWNRSKKKWQCTISEHNRSVHLGWFISEEKAAESYNRAALRSFGEFAKLNKVSEIA